MPEDSKKNEKKNAKEQREPRQRHQQGKAEKKAEKVEEPQSAPKVTVPQKPPVYESPPPEFFKNLKRETDEILKITEEENTKYKKKEIQSNWSKYEVPIESYDEIDEQENLGADYEKLIEAPLSVGGHFQFKHEKSWDINTGPSPYDKYFDINMEDLNIAICTIPFNERNNIEQTLFNDTDLLTMNNRSTRFKQKYFNDKSFSTPEMEAQDKILSSLRDTKMNDNKTENKDIEIKTDVRIPPFTEIKPSLTDVNLEFNTATIDSNKIVEDNLQVEKPTTELEVIEKDDLIFVKPSKPNFEADKLEAQSNQVPEAAAISQVEVKPAPVETKVVPEVKVTKVVPPPEAKVAVIETKLSQPTATVAAGPVEPKKDPVIESPEDLEKWLDDFLDG
ncbi:apoptosis and caspase activation inhibitor [Anticarsia gemmatalis]|uniref:apoptosis and caspase activation inhibitor n=1 Tax=Anticarsia gemmatalis TaxID=129554 RepID=UPI003F759B4F